MNISTPVIALAAQPSPVIVQHRLQWDTVDVLMGGTAAMKSQAERFLRKEAEEGELEYQNRLARTFLNPFYKQAVQQATGKVFSKDVQFDKADPVLALWTQDVDGQKRNLSRFSMDTFKDAINHGVSYILVDMPHVQAPFKNAAEQNKASLRPYWVNIPSSKVVKLHSETVNGVEKLLLFSFREDVMKLTQGGYSQELVEQIREYRQLHNEETGQLGDVVFTVYRKVNSDWQIHQRETLRQKNAAIPVVAVYANQTGFYTGSPVFMDLAELSIQHWNKSSDLENILHIANVPFLFARALKSGTNEDGVKEPLKVSIHRALIANNKDASIEWVEHTGAAIETAMASLERLETRMKELGNQLLVEASTNVTATQSAISSADANSTLKAMALNLQDALEIAMVFTGDLLGTTRYGKIKVNTAYAEEQVAASTFADVKTAFDLGLIDREQTLVEAKRRGIIAQDAKLAPEPVEPVVQPGQTTTQINDSGNATE